MAAPRARDPKDTPLMRQWAEVKERHPDAIVFFRLGDFYEMFGDDARTAAAALELTLTTRDKGRDDAIPMCGVPHHSSQGYVARLIEQGFKVVICEQVEDPRLAKGIVRREVVRIVTPGIVLDEEQLEAKRGHYLASVVVDRPGAPTRIGLSFLDVTTGEFVATELADGDGDGDGQVPAPAHGVDDRAGGGPLDRFLDELARFRPSELLLPPDAEALRACFRGPITRVDAAPGAGEARGLIADVLGDPAAPAAFESRPLALAAAAQAVRYARAMQPAGKLPLTRLTPYAPGDFLVLDDTTRRNLELTENSTTGKKHGSLLGLIDETRTAMGGRLLRSWLTAPLTDVVEIARRHDAVAALVGAPALRHELRELLARIYDLERLAARAKLGVATPRDLGRLRQSIDLLPALTALLEPLEQPLLATDDPHIFAGVGALGARLHAMLVDDPPVNHREGGVIRAGVNADLDELVDASNGGKSKIAAIEERERARTGISSLKVRFNSVFGYYIEVTRSNLAAVPADYIRKQTVANAERFITPELADHEAKVLGAEERRVVLEAELFEALRAELGASASLLMACAARVAAIDTLAALAEVAHTRGYVRPTIDDGELLEIEAGRHPVVEALAAPGGFVPNDTRLSPDAEQLVVLTGPNMAGKSTVMRQVALIALLGHAGSFVPARRARIGRVDRIFTRVGAADNLARGESTFMVEMRETAAILRHATRRSLILLDEIGRGTSTFDGVSIAWAVAEHVHDAIGARTIFATHYHELCALAEALPRVRNFSVAVSESPDGREVVFLRTLVPRGASRSYGIEVARLAGLPRSVVERARARRGELEQRTSTSAGTAGTGRSTGTGTGTGARADMEAEVAQEILALSLDALTPRQALDHLYDLHARLSKTPVV